MPQIDAIRFRKYKSFGEEYSTIPLKRMTVLIGRNNSGKSSCIDVIEAFCNPETLASLKMSSLDLSVERTLSNDEWMKLFLESGYRQNGYPDLLPFRGKKCGFTLYSRGSGNHAEIYSDLVHNSEEEITRYHIRWRSLEEQIDTYIKRSSFFRINSERDIVPEPENNSGTISENGNGATSFINYVLNNALKDEHLIQRDLLEALNIIIYPDAKYTGITVQKLNTELWEIFLYEGDERRALSKMGSGLKTIILVLLNLIVLPKIKHLSYSEDSATVFAFEELENNLHPALQRRLFDYIARYSKEHPNTYIFLTTHSHVPINMFANQEDAQILHVTKENGASSVQIVDGFITKSEVLNDLDVRASDLLQSNGIIWVEGPSDRIYIKHWMEIWGGEDLREGIDYQFLYYGGRLLSHYSADEIQEDSDLIGILTTNRNSAIVIDSDKTSQSKPINDTKKRIQAEFDRLNLFCWITKGKEIENYVPCQAINDRYGCELAQCGKYELFPDYIKTIRPSFISEKVRFASKLIDRINTDNSDNILDLKQQIQILIKTVRGWTPDKHSSQP